MAAGVDEPLYFLASPAHSKYIRVRALRREAYVGQGRCNGAGPPPWESIKCPGLSEDNPRHFVKKSATSQMCRCACSQKYARTHTEIGFRKPSIPSIPCSQSCSQSDEKGRIRANDDQIENPIGKPKKTLVDAGGHPLDGLLISRFEVRILVGEPASEGPGQWRPGLSLCLFWAYAIRLCAGRIAPAPRSGY